MPGTSGSQNRRRRLIVNRELQFPFVKAMVFVLCAMTTASLGAIVLATRITLSTYELSNDALFVALFNAVFWLVMVELVLVIPFVVWLGIWMTHKVAGPLVRVHAALSQMARGDYNVTVRLRKGDMLTDLADAVNHLAGEMRRRSG